MEKLWGDLFIKVTQSILDAFSHVDEFDIHTFMFSIFTSSKPVEDVIAQAARTHAKDFINEANTVIENLMTYRPKGNQNQDIPESWWHNQVQYKNACTQLQWLQNWTEVIPKLQQSINDLSPLFLIYAYIKAGKPGIIFKTTRKNLITFKKECEKAINGINCIINNYNRFIALNHPDYRLTSVNLLKGSSST